MILSRFIDFLKDNVVGFTLGTRNADLEPAVGKPRAVIVSDDCKHLTFHLPEVALSEHLDNLKDNGQVSLNVVSLSNFEAYQFKGTFKEATPCTADQIEEIIAWKTKFIEGCRNMGYPESMLEGLDKQIIEPAQAITFEVTDIFEQAPKPGSGNKIS